MGMRSLEHSAYLLKACTPLKDSLRQKYKSIKEIGDSQEMTSAYLEINEAEILTFNKDLCARMASTLAFNETAVTPTLVVQYKYWNRPEKNFYMDPNLRFMPEGSKEWWKAENSSLTAEEWKIGKTIHILNLRIVRELHDAGVLLLAGTDSPYNIPGFTLHEELELLVEAGLSPIEAIKTATINPAIFLNRQHELGSIEEGKLADLVLLNKNPLQDISNTKTIHGIFADGKYLNKKSINKLLKEMDNR